MSLNEQGIFRACGGQCPKEGIISLLKGHGILRTRSITSSFSLNNFVV